MNRKLREAGLLSPGHVLSPHVIGGPLMQLAEASRYGRDYGEETHKRLQKWVVTPHLDRMRCL